jgi:hypothetical protein
VARSHSPIAAILRFAHAFLARNRDVKVTLVVSAVDHRDADDHELAVLSGERRLVPDGGQEIEPALRDRRAVEQHAINVGYLAVALRADLGRERRDFLVRRFIGVADAGHAGFL